MATNNVNNINTSTTRRPHEQSLVGSWYNKYLKERSQMYAEIHERATLARSK